MMKKLSMRLLFTFYYCLSARLFMQMFFICSLMMRSTAVTKHWIYKMNFMISIRSMPVIFSLIESQLSSSHCSAVVRSG